MRRVPSRRAARRTLAVLSAAAAAALAPAVGRAQEATFEFRSSALWTNIAGMRIVDSTAYCGVGEGFLTLSLNDIENPEVRSFAISPDSTVARFEFEPPLGYLNMASAGVAVVEALDRDAPRVVETIPPRFGPVTGATGRDSLVYVAEDGTLATYLIDGVSDPLLLGLLPLPTGEAQVTFAAGRLILFGPAGLFACEIQPDGLPALSDTLFTGDRVLSAAGDSASVWAAFLGKGEIAGFVAGDSGGFVEVQRIAATGVVSDVAVADGFLAVASDEGFAAYALSDSGTASLLFDRYDGVPATHVAVDDRTLGVARAVGGIEFFAILLPFDFANVQNVNTGAAFVHGERDGDFLYVATNDSGVYRYSATPGPTIDGPTRIVSGNPQSVAVRDSVVIVGTSALGITVYAGQPGGPVAFQSLLRFGGSPLDIDVRDTLAVIGAAQIGVVIAGISSLAAPTELDIYKPNVLFNSRRVAFVEDRLLYALQQNIGLHILDLSTPEFPQVDTVLVRDLAVDFDLDLAAQRFLLLSGPEGSRRALLYDIANPRAPALLDSLDVPSGERVSIDGDVALVAKTAGGFYRLSVAGGARLGLEGEGATIGPVRWIAQRAGTTYFLEASSGVQVFVGTTVAELAARGRFVVGGNVVSVAAEDSTIVAGDAFGTLTLMRVAPGGVFDVGDTLLLGDRVRAISFLSGDTLCAVASGSDLVMIDIDRTAGMTLLGRLTLSGQFVNTMAAFQEFLLLAGAGPTVFTVDVSDPTAPELVSGGFSALGQSGVPSAGNVRELVFRGTSLFVAFRGAPDGSLPALITSWDVSSSVGQPRYLGHYPASGVEIRNAVIDGVLLYASTAREGIHVISIDDPTQMRLVNVIRTVEQPEAVTVVGDFLVTTSGYSGFAALDLGASGTAPPLVAAVDTPGFARNVAALPGLILIADASALLIYGTEVVVVDSLPPDFAIGLVANPFVTAHADLYVIPNERLSGPPTIRFAINETDVMLNVGTSDDSARVYVSRMILDQLGTALFEVSGCDRRSNCGTTQMTLEIEFLRGLLGGVISIDDGALKVHVDPGAFAGEARFVALPTREIDLAAGGRAGPLPDGASERGYDVAILGASAVPLRVSFRAAGPTGFALQVFRRDAGAWTPLPSRAVGDRVEAASIGGGLFWLAAGEADGDLRPSRAALHPNAPNPFNPSTQIRYDVPATGARVRLAVYSIDGRLVRCLADGFEPAGTRARTWDGRGDDGRHAASGLYILRYDAGGESLTRKLSLLR
jgi:hypothetical protein